MPFVDVVIYKIFYVCVAIYLAWAIVSLLSYVNSSTSVPAAKLIKQERLRSPNLLNLSRNSMAKDGCVCRYKNTSYDFCYRFPEDMSIRGKRFSCKYASYLQALDLLSKRNAVDLVNGYMPNPKFVTAMSENHYFEGLTLIANIRKFWKMEWIIVYDLGLANKSASNLRSKCFVEMRQFPFDMYPEHVKNLTEYRWKPLLIAKTLNEFGAVWYMDTSIRWPKDIRESFYKKVACRRKTRLDKSPAIGHSDKASYLLSHPTIHGTYAATHPGKSISWKNRAGKSHFPIRACTPCDEAFKELTGLYKYLPTNIKKLKETLCYSAAFAFIVRTADTVELMKWSVLCALEKNCMAPPGANLSCTFGNDMLRDYAYCHRYDQSVVNVLLANSYNYNPEKYVVSEGDVAQAYAGENHQEEDFACG